MRKIWMATIPVFIVTLAGCGSSNPPAQMPTLSQGQIDAEEQHQREVAEMEMLRQEALPNAKYISKEEAATNEVDRAETRRAEALPHSRYVSKEEAAVNAAEQQRAEALGRRRR
jgi:hypothetical protein